MNTITGFRILLKKELREYFRSPMIYTFIGIFSFIVGAVFYSNLVSTGEITNYNIVDSIMAPTFSAMGFLLMIFTPMLTMGSFVKEKKEGTLQLLFLSRLTRAQVFWAKFFALMLVELSLLLPTIIFPLILMGSGFDDFAMVITNYIALIGLICCYLSVGLLASLVTSNYIVAILLTFSALFSFLILYQTGMNVSNEMLSNIIRYLSLGQHTYYFSRGAVMVSDFVYFASFVTFFSYVSIRIMGVKK